MPTYTYKCQTCDEVFDVYQSFSAKTLKKHPECGGAVQKVFHPAGIVFKGSGFYKTDSKTSENPKKAKPTSTVPKSEKKSSSAPKDKPSTKSSSTSPE